MATSDMEGRAPETGAGPFKDAVLIAGPTASGKSALALQIAQEIGGEIVNADSMQVYSVLRVLTARPGAADTALVPHHLYGHVAPDRNHSTGAWLRAVADLPREVGGMAKRYVFVGGTGLYFRALTGGLSEMPTIPADIREFWRERLRREGAEALHDVLSSRDSVSAIRIRPADGQRIARALEVLDATGRPISHWQSIPGVSLIEDESARRMVLEPDDGMLRTSIERRFDKMVEAGAFDEVRALLEMRLDPALPAMKAIGVPELASVLREEIGLDIALERAKAATRKYAKRQRTWFRHQLGPEWHRTEISSGR